MKKFLKILLSTLILGCACSPDMPQMPYTPEMYIGISQYEAICRYDNDDQMICIDSNHPKFDNYKCLSHQDVAMLQQYITTLSTSCKDWNK